jgi:hypothetical protein
MTEAGIRTVHDLCLIDKGIGYASQLPGAVEDSSNRYDTAQTVAEIEAHNLRFEAICPTQETPSP